MNGSLILVLSLGMFSYYLFVSSDSDVSVLFYLIFNFLIIP